MRAKLGFVMAIVLCSCNKEQEPTLTIQGDDLYLGSRQGCVVTTPVTMGGDIHAVLVRNNEQCLPMIALFSEQFEVELGQCVTVESVKLTTNYSNGIVLAIIQSVE